MMTKLPKGYYVDGADNGKIKLANKTLSLILFLSLFLSYSDFVFYHNSMKESFDNDDNGSFALIGGIFMVYFMGLIYPWP
jgi:Cu(I)/Ag(I) efflux system membrane protein CusA/SilA